MTHAERVADATSQSFHDDVHWDVPDLSVRPTYEDDDYEEEDDDVRG